MTSHGSTVYTPAQIRAAYGINNLALDGTGQTIAIVDAYDNPNIYQSLDAFDHAVRPGDRRTEPVSAVWPSVVLPDRAQPARPGQPLPATDPSGAGVSNWEMEEALDVEWAHAIAPGANIVLVESQQAGAG